MIDIGQVLGERFRVERLLGSGRFASVFSATDIVGGGSVAIKVFKPSTERRTAVGRRFFRRIKTGKKSPHPVILPLVDGGKTDDGVPFLVMELLEGRTLEQELQAEGALPFGRAIDIARILTQGLAVVHAAGQVHRNINPSNVFLVKNEREGPPLRLLDMGVAQDLVDYLAIAPSDIGSTSYLAPEILIESNKAWSAAVDVFAVGMVLYRMLTGLLPVERESESSVAPNQRKNTINIYISSLYRLPGPSKHAPYIPGVLDDLVTRAISIEPEERYRNAQEFAHAIEAMEMDLDLSPEVGAGSRDQRIKWEYRPAPAAPPNEATVTEAEPPCCPNASQELPEEEEATVPENERPIISGQSRPTGGEKLSPKSGDVDMTVPEKARPVISGILPTDLWDDLLKSNDEVEKTVPEEISEIHLFWKKPVAGKDSGDEVTLPYEKPPIISGPVERQSLAAAGEHQMIYEPTKRLDLSDKEPMIYEPTKKLDLSEAHQMIYEPTKKLDLSDKEPMIYEPTKKLDLSDKEPMIYEPTKKLDLPEERQAPYEPTKKLDLSDPSSDARRSDPQTPKTPGRNRTRMFIGVLCGLIILAMLAVLVFTVVE